MAQILVVDDDLNLLQMVKLMLQRVGHQVQTASNGEEGIAQAGTMMPELAIIDVMMPGLSGYDVVRRMREDPRTTRIPIIILTARSQPMDKHMALEAGANAFLSKPVTAQELTERVDAVLKAGVNYRVHTGLLTEPVRQSPPPAQPSVPKPGPSDSQIRPPASKPGPADSQPRPPERRPIGVTDTLGPDAAPSPAVQLPVITVIGLRGGTGSTTVAINLAYLLASRGRRVCLTDLSTASSHIPLHLHLAPPQNWGSLLNMGDKPDPRLIPQLVVQHHATGIGLLAAPPVPSAHTLSAAAVQAVFTELANGFNHIVVDAPNLDNAAVGSLLVSKSIVVVMTDDPPSVQTAGQLLVAMQSLGVEMGRVRVALNYVRPTKDVPLETIQKALRRPLSGVIPYEPNQMSAIRRGTPLVVAEPQGVFAQAIEQLARTITF